MKRIQKAMRAILASSDGKHTKIAKNLGVNLATVYKWENGQIEPGLNSLQKIIKSYPFTRKHLGL